MDIIKGESLSSSPGCCIHPQKLNIPKCRIYMERYYKSSTFKKSSYFFQSSWSVDKNYDGTGDNKVYIEQYICAEFFLTVAQLICAPQSIENFAVPSFH